MTSLPTEVKSNNYVFGKSIGPVPATWDNATISGVGRPTGGAENRLVQSVISVMEFRTTGVFLRRDIDVSLKKAFFARDFRQSRQVFEERRPASRYSGTVMRVTFCWRHIPREDSRLKDKELLVRILLCQGHGT
jgi:hypothetical protein